MAFRMSMNSLVPLRSFGYESERKDGQLIKYMFTNMKGNKWKKVRSMMSG